MKPDLFRCFRSVFRRYTTASLPVDAAVSAENSGAVKAGASSCPRSDTLPTPQLVAALKARVGQRGVFRETGFLAPILIQAMKCGPTNFSATLLPVDGIVLRYTRPWGRRDEAFNVGAAWDMLQVEPDAWTISCSGCCWTVLLSKAACDAVLRVVREKSKLPPAVVFRLADGMCRLPGLTKIPDSVEELNARIETEWLRRQA